MKKSIRIFYFIFTAYMLFVCLCSSLKLIDVFIGILLIWISYFLFVIGMGREDMNNAIKEEKEISLFGINKDKVRMSRIFIVSGASLLGYFICARFYTGFTPFSMIRALESGQSTYQTYQAYFAKNNLATMTLAKMPIVLIMAANRILWVYSFISLTVSGRILRKKSIIYLIIISLGHIYFGLCRGTNFEMFQLCIIIYLCYMIAHEKERRKINYILLIIIGIIMVVFFLLLLEKRGHTITLHDKLVSNIYIEKNSVVAEVIPFLVVIAEWVFDYLGYGIYYISVMIQDVMMKDLIGFIDLFIPIKDAYIETNLLADRGTKWEPDLARLIDGYGIIVAILVPFLLGVLLKLARNVVRNYTYYYIVFYLVFVEMISLPMGTFLRYSSERVLIVFTVFMILIGERYRLKSYI